MAKLTFWQETLARELVRLRDVAGLKQRQVASEMKWSIGKVWKIENASSAISPEDLERLLDLYGISGRTRSTLEGMNQSARGGWFDLHSEYLPNEYMEYIRLEDQASHARLYDVAAVLNGLLQTEEYAREIVAANSMGLLSPRAIDRRVDVRMKRQEVLTRDEPLVLEVVLAESVLRWKVGGRDAMRRQREHLLELCELPNVEIRVLPFSAGAHPGMHESFTVFALPGAHVPDVAYTEGIAGNRYLIGEDGEGYSLALARLQALALGVKESRKYLATLNKD